MKQLKKTILTLVALLAVTTGAWADETPLLTIESKDNTSFKSGSMTFDDKVTVTFSSSVRNDGDEYGWYADASLLTVAGTNGYTITSCKFYTPSGVAKTGYTVAGESPSVYLSSGMVFTDASETVYLGDPGIKKIEVFGAVASASSGPEVAWDKAENSGTFTMPGGNVTLEPEYYPQAALATQPTAINDVPATTDGAIVNAGTVKNIGETATAQGTLMYYVSPTALDDAALLALAADQWTADVPTAADLAQGQAYVYYYVRGNDSDNDDETFSDGDILAANALTVTIAAAPTYAVTFAEGTDPNEWTASPATGVKKGTEVTVTYSGTKKVIGVKAEKKAAAAEEPVADIVWDATNVTDLEVWGTLLSYEKEGVTLSGNADQVQAEWNNSAYLETPGMEFIMMESGGFTFTAPAGKAFTKIEMKAQGLTGWNNVNLGTGWTYFEDDDNEIFTVTWKGSAASAVKLLKDADMFSGDFISSIAFYLSE